MHNRWRIALIALACLGVTAPAARADSANKTVMVRIIIPPREDLSAPGIESGADPLAELAPVAGRARSTTLVHDGPNLVLLHTDTPLF